MSCECAVCVRYNRWKEITKDLPDDDKKFMDSVLEDLLNLEYDESCKKMSRDYMKRRHKKTGNIYEITNVNAIDVTNSRDGTPVYIYKNEDGRFFVREKAEFNEKFETIEKDM